MTTNSPGLDWFAFMPRLPWSGNVNERITAPWFSPTVNLNYAGDAHVEDRVVTEVASYGRQLGWLNEITLALATNKPVPTDVLDNLKAANERIDTIKEESRVSALDAAKRALDRLEREHPDDYGRLLRERKAGI